MNDKIDSTALSQSHNKKTYIKSNQRKMPGLLRTTTFRSQTMRDYFLPVNGPTVWAKTHFTSAK